VALAMIVLMSFSTFVIDYGVLWTARRQAQNAADAAALAGAVALAFDKASDFSDTGPAKTIAYQVVMSHPVWGQQPVVNITTDITFPPCPDDDTTTCIRVDVYRNQAHGNPLPMIFGQLVGLNQQGVRAMAKSRWPPRQLPAVGTRLRDEYFRPPPTETALVREYDRRKRDHTSLTPPDDTFRRQRQSRARDPPANPQVYRPTTKGSQLGDKTDFLRFAGSRPGALDSKGANEYRPTSSVWRIDRQQVASTENMIGPTTGGQYRRDLIVKRDPKRLGYR
jgi:hypothetical protein